MRRSFLLSTAALAGALALGCADQQSPMAPAADPSSPSVVERLPAFAALQMGGDPSNPLALQAGYLPGVTAEDICADPSARVDTEAQKGQDVFTPSGGLHEHVSGRDVHLVLYQFGGGPVTTQCQLVGAPVLGTGTGNFTWNVNVGGPGGPVVIHLTIHGTIDLVGGGQARVLGTARVLILPDGTLFFDEERVRLTPL
jgi:hypothetical protein